MHNEEFFFFSEMEIILEGQLGNLEWRIGQIAFGTRWPESKSKQNLLCGVTLFPWTLHMRVHAQIPGPRFSPASVIVIPALGKFEVSQISGLCYGWLHCPHITI